MLNLRTGQLSWCVQQAKLPHLTFTIRGYNYMTTTCRICCVSLTRVDVFWGEQQAAVTPTLDVAHWRSLTHHRLPDMWPTSLRAGECSVHCRGSGRPSADTLAATSRPDSRESSASRRARPPSGRQWIADTAARRASMNSHISPTQHSMTFQSFPQL